MKSVVMLVVLALSLAACACFGSDSIVKSGGTELRRADRETLLAVEASTVKVQVDFDVVEVMPDGKDGLYKDTWGLSGSGTIVATQEDEELDRSLILTAYHVCKGVEKGDVIDYWFWRFRVTDVKMTVLTVDKKVLKQKIVKDDVKHDACVLETNGAAGPAAQIAKKLPERKTHVIVAGAPAGEWGPYAAYVADEGYLVSKKMDDEGMRYYLKLSDTKPTQLEDFLYFTSPGTGGISGGGTYDVDGRLFSMYTANSWDHGGLGPHLRWIRKIVDDALNTWKE